MKICNKCNQEKPLTEFNKKRDGKQPWCRECNKIRSKQYYQENKEKHKKDVTIRRKRILQENLDNFNKLKSHCKCSICSENTPICLDFHHTRDKEKQIIVGIYDGWAWNTIINEMKKCIVLCSNCHRKYHAGLLNIDNIKTWNDEVYSEDYHIEQINYQTASSLRSEA